jgi:hypothetical protein
MISLSILAILGGEDKDCDGQGAAGRGGAGCIPSSTMILLDKNAGRVLSLALLQSLLGKASKSLQTFQELSTNFP